MISSFILISVLFQASEAIQVPGNVLPIQSPLQMGGWDWSTPYLLKQRLGEPDHRFREGRLGEWWVYQVKGVWFRMKVDPDAKRPVLPNGGLVDAVRLVAPDAGSIAGVKVGDSRERTLDQLGTALLSSAMSGQTESSLRFLGGKVEVQFSASNKVAWIQLFSPTLKHPSAIAEGRSPTVKLLIPPVASGGTRLEPAVSTSVLAAIREYFGRVIQPSSEHGEAAPEFPFVELVDNEAAAGKVLELTLTEFNWAETKVGHTYLVKEDAKSERFACPAVAVTTKLRWRLRSAKGGVVREGDLNLHTLNSREHKAGQVCVKPDIQQALIFGAVPRISARNTFGFWSGGTILTNELFSLGPDLRICQLDLENGLVGIDPESLHYSNTHFFSVSLRGLQLETSTPGRQEIVLGGPPRVEFLRARSITDKVLWCEVLTNDWLGMPSSQKKWRLIERLPEPSCYLLSARQIRSPVAREVSRIFETGETIVNGMQQRITSVKQ